MLPAMRGSLEDSKALFIRRWGEMGGSWGISRTMAEMHALMFVAGRPLCTDDIMQQLHVSRGNASMNLRALVDWGLVERVHKLGDRKEYFQADTDVWRMFETIMRERRRREVEPIITTLNRCREMVAALGDNSAPDAADVRAYRQRIDELQQFLATMSSLFELVLQFGHRGIGQLAQLLTDRGSPTAAKPAPRRGRNSTRKDSR
jgi:DNA-binding transcriptional regulator GbsR (MarR family)